MAFKPPFVASMEELLGTAETALLLDALEDEPVVSVRFNPFKVSQKPAGDPIAWCRYGFYLDRRPSFTLDPAFAGGAYYVQEAGSMFVEALMRRAFGQCDGLRVLDLCASPGGKTTLLATLVGPEGLVVANEPIRSRVQPLIDNAVKWGSGNIAVTHNDPEAIGALRDMFDAVLVDAPCSGEGMMRKNPLARAQWSPENVRLCAARQRRIVAEAWRTLRPGGVLIYSTCTFNRTENERNIVWMAEELGAEGLPIEVGFEGVVQGEVAAASHDIRTFRFFPHRVRSEGFFSAVMRKPAGKAHPSMPRPRGIFVVDADKASAAALSRWVDQPEWMRFARIGERFHGYYAAQYPFVKELAGRLSVIYSGVAMGELFHGKLRPDHPLAQFVGIDPDVTPGVEFAVDEALAYLRKQEMAAERFVEGMNRVCFGGLPLGWAKRIGRRINNLYPKELRILSQIPGHNAQDGYRHD